MPARTSKKKSPNKNLRRPLRARSSYLSSDPEKRARQNANLINSPEKQKERSKKAQAARAEVASLQDIDIVEFATRHLGVKFKGRPAQEVVLRAYYGLPLSDEKDIPPESVILDIHGAVADDWQSQEDIYRILTGSNEPYEPGKPKRELILNIGRRGGKSLTVSIIALYEGTRDHWARYADKGEDLYFLIVATKQQQAEKIVQANCARMMERASKALAGQLLETFRAELVLKNGNRIHSIPCNSTSGRGLPTFGMIGDEVAWFLVEGARADEEIFGAIEPALAQFPGSKQVMISTPRSKQGIFWKRHNEGLVPGRLTVTAPTRMYNPLIDQQYIDRKYREDPDMALREFGAVFAERAEAFFDIPRLDAAFQLEGDTPPRKGNDYYCGIDQSGLTGRDRFAMSIAHRAEGEQVKVDVVRSWDTTDDDIIISDVRDLCRKYGVSLIWIDQYAKGWIRSRLMQFGFTVQTRSSLPSVYMNGRRLINTGDLFLPADEALQEGLRKTEAYYGRNNSIAIQHERDKHGHADVADAVMTAVWAASQGDEMLDSEFLYVEDTQAQYEEEIGEHELAANWDRWGGFDAWN